MKWIERDVESKEGDTLHILLKATMGYLPGSKDDYLVILNKLFPHAELDKNRQ